MEKTSNFSATALLAEQEELFAALNAEEEALMAPVKARIEAIRLEWRAARDSYSESIGEALKEFTFEDLTDPLRAAEFYEADHNGGWGVKGSREIYRELFLGTYIFDSDTRSYGSEGKLTYLAPQVGIPAKPEEAWLLATAEKVEAVHRANIELLGEADGYEGDAQISVFDDGLSSYESYSIILEDSQWILRGNYGRELSRAAELIDILRITPTYN